MVQGLSRLPVGLYRILWRKILYLESEICSSFNKGILSDREDTFTGCEKQISVVQIYRKYLRFLTKGFKNLSLIIFSLILTESTFWCFNRAYRVCFSFLQFSQNWYFSEALTTPEVWLEQKYHLNINQTRWRFLGEGGSNRELYFLRVDFL